MATLIIHPSQKGLYRLTLAEILYYLPDYKDLLQSYLWEDYDFLPDLPKLHRFIDFWQQELSADLHSVKVCVQTDLKPAQVTILFPEALEK